MKKKFVFVLTIAVLLICVACSQDQIEKMGKGFTKIGNVNLGYGDRVAVGNVTTKVDEIVKDDTTPISDEDLDAIRSLIIEASQSDASAEAVKQALAKKVEGTDKPAKEATNIAAVVSDPSASVEDIGNAVDELLEASGIEIEGTIDNEDVVNVLKQAVPTLVALDKVLTERNTKTYKSQGDIIATSLITDIVDSVVKLAEDPSASSEKIEELVKVVQTDVSVIETIYGVDFDLANLISIAGKLK